MVFHKHQLVNLQLFLELRYYMYWFRNSVKINRVFLEYLGWDDYVFIIYVFIIVYLVMRVRTSVGEDLKIQPPNIEVQSSLVRRAVWDRDIGGSNPSTSTKGTSTDMFTSCTCLNKSLYNLETVFLGEHPKIRQYSLL